jgi:hypothetical protein
MRLFALCILFTSLSSHAVSENPPQVPNPKTTQSDEASNSKGAAPVTVVNNCNPATQGEQKASSSPTGRGPIGGNVPDWILAIVGVFTFIAVWRQSVQTGRSAKAAEESARAVRDGIVLAYRPRLVIRSIELHLGSILTQDDPTKIKYVLANVGGTQATIAESNLTPYRVDGPLPEIPPYSAERGVLGNATLRAGEYWQGALHMDSSEGLIFRVTTVRLTCRVLAARYSCAIS